MNDKATKSARPRWLGEIPEHWRLVPIRHVARLESGHTPSRQHPEYWENCAIPWFTLGDVWQLRDDRRVYVSETKERVNELGLTNSSARLLPAGTVMLSRTASVGFSGIMAVPMATTQDFANWVCGSELLPEYLLYVFRSMRSEFDRLIMGSTHQTIYMPDIAELSMPLPPIDEQRMMVAFIDEKCQAIDALLDKRQRLIDLLTEYRTAIINRAVTKGLDPNVPMKESGIEWLGAVPAHWVLPRIKQVARMESGHTPSRKNPEYWVDCTIPWFSLGDVWQLRDDRTLYVNETSECISELGIANSSARLLPRGTVILSRTASVGFSGILIREMATTQDFVNWICGPRIAPEFLLFVLRAMRSDLLGRLTMGSTHKTIYVPDALDLKTPLPPMDEQAAIVEFILSRTVRIDSLIDITQQSIAKLHELRTSLISEVVTGKIDVRAVGAEAIPA